VNQLKSNHRSINDPARFPDVRKKCCVAL